MPHQFLAFIVQVGQFPETLSTVRYLPSRSPHDYHSLNVKGPQTTVYAGNDFSASFTVR